MEQPMKIKTGLRVTIDAEALERIWQWTELAKGEVSCLGQVTDDLLVHDVQLFDQVCTQASTELDQDALAKFLCKHHEPEKVRAWIHSHGNLSVFWSAQDDSCIEGLANESYLVSIVVNKRHEIRCRVDFFEPVRLTLDEVPLEVRVPALDLRKECETAFRTHVTEVQPMVVRQQSMLPEPGGMMRGRAWPDFDDDDMAMWGGR